ncbi:MAG: ATP-binding protein [Bacilli bacterium]|nr:ATP-binding protein [Bacilli bacterium]
MNFSETHDIELKGTLNEKVEKEIVAFLNTNNGTIYIGVENNGNIVGIVTNKLDESMKKISDIITDKILPNPQEFVTTSAFIDEGKWIIKIDVQKGNAL